MKKYDKEKVLNFLNEVFNITNEAVKNISISKIARKNKLGSNITKAIYEGNYIKTKIIGGKKYIQWNSVRPPNSYMAEMLIKKSIEIGKNYNERVQLKKQLNKKPATFDNTMGISIPPKGTLIREDGLRKIDYEIRYNNTRVYFQEYSGVQSIYAGYTHTTFKKVTLRKKSLPYKEFLEFIKSNKFLNESKFEVNEQQEIHVENDIVDPINWAKPIIQEYVSKLFQERIELIDNLKELEKLDDLENKMRKIEENLRDIENAQSVFGKPITLDRVVLAQNKKHNKSKDKIVATKIDKNKSFSFLWGAIKVNW